MQKKLAAAGLTIVIGFLFLAGLGQNAAAESNCPAWVGKLVSIQGEIQFRPSDQSQWLPAALNQTFCPGDIIRVGRRSRAAVSLINDTTMRLDQKTSLTFGTPRKRQSLLLNVLKGAAHFFSHRPHSLQIVTPFVNGTVEGTEFFVHVEADQTLLSIMEGRVRAQNEINKVVLGNGQSVLAKPGQALQTRITVAPRDAVRWTLYYPLLLDFYTVSIPGEMERLRRSQEFARKGDLTNAFNALDSIDNSIRDADFFLYRAALLTFVGRFAEAQDDMRATKDLDADSGKTAALEAIIAVVQNRKQEALGLARTAVSKTPKSALAWLAMAYVRQAHFELDGALESVRNAVSIAPANGTVWMRLAELQLSMGALDDALFSARNAVRKSGQLAQAHIVEGFAYLTQLNTHAAIQSFDAAIKLDSAAPLPRLGKGLARIRQGDLAAGRRQIEIAAALDPGNSLIRSYLGKAFFEEKRDSKARRQLDVAKRLDPQDPTPWFYDALRKQSLNRPVEALRDLQKSYTLNDNRAIYRSRFLLDQDLAVRSAGLGRIYRELGFEQRALAEGWQALANAPDNYSAHRFLADTYSSLPRHQDARVSELLQSQMLQPINITPLQPLLAESNTHILEGAGPADPAFNEFGPLFQRNRLALTASGLIGSNDTLGDELVHAGVWENLSYSIGQFHYENDGIRTNNDQELNLYNVYVQASLSHKTSLMAEFRNGDENFGDRVIEFEDIGDFDPDLRQREAFNSLRMGARHALKPNSTLLATAIFRTQDSSAANFGELATSGFTADLDFEADGFMSEVQHLYTGRHMHLTSGGGYSHVDRTENIQLSFLPIPSITHSSSEHFNLYSYAQIKFPESVTWTLGAAFDSLEGNIKDKDLVSPKLGAIWRPFDGTSFRAAAFRSMRRIAISGQTLEPTQVAGFNQLFDDFEASDSWTYGIGIDQKLGQTLFSGIEFMRRDLDVPFTAIVPMGPPEVREDDWNENNLRAYLYWAAHPWLSTGIEYFYERFEHDFWEGPQSLRTLTTQRFIPSVRLFHPSGLNVRLKASYIDQKGKLGNTVFGFESKSDHFWVIDAATSYRLPKRWGIFSIEVKNLFNEDFNFQDTDPSSPRITSERQFIARMTISF